LLSRRLHHPLITLSQRYDDAMKEHARLLGRSWLLLVAGMLLIVGHGIILYYISLHLVVSATVVTGVAVLFAVKHLGLLGPLYAVFRRKMRVTAVPQDQDDRDV
jgi:hypothetical protein